MIQIYLQIIVINKFRSVLYFLGTKGCGKTTLLLTFVQSFLKDNFKRWGTMYFNVRYLKDLSLVDSKKLLLKESLYLFNNIDELNSFKLNHPFKNIYEIVFKQPIQTVKNYIETILEQQKEILKKKEGIIFIIDNFDIHDDSEVNCLNKIIEYIGNVKQDIKLIVSGTGKFFNQKIRNYFLNNINLHETIIYINNNSLGFPEICNREIQNIPLYYFQFISNNEGDYPQYKNKIINQEKEYLKTYNFNTLYYSLDLDKLIIPLKDFQNFDIFISLPDYFRIDYNEGNKNFIKFEISNPIFYEAIKETIEFMVKENLYQKVIIEKLLPETSCGFAEEYLISLLFKNNKFKVKNFNDFKYIKKVKQIFDFQKNSIIEFQNFPGNIIVLQDFNGENYDLLFIININGIDYAIFIQIGVDKNETQIIKIYNDLIENSQNYVDNLNFSYKKKIKYINLLFIFDENNQESKIPHNCGTKICEKLKIDYLWFSLENKNLIKVNYDTKKDFIISKAYLTEYNPNFLIEKRSEYENKVTNNKIDLNSDIKPIYEINKEQEYLINKTVKSVYQSKYLFSPLFGKNFQIFIQKDLIEKLIGAVSEKEIPNIHVFYPLKPTEPIYLMINKCLYTIVNGDIQGIHSFNDINYKNLSWDIYPLILNN